MIQKKMKTVYFVTGNSHKFQVAQEVLEKKGIEVIQQKLETPEIQSTDVKEIACFSAKWASEKINRPVALTDAGYYIESLNGFPGPFITALPKPRNLLRVIKAK